jgi:hypothetical protein
MIYIAPKSRLHVARNLAAALTAWDKKLMVGGFIKSEAYSIPEWLYESDYETCLSHCQAILFSQAVFLWPEDPKSSWLVVGPFMRGSIVDSVTLMFLVTSWGVAVKIRGKDTIGISEFETLEEFSSSVEDTLQKVLDELCIIWGIV